MFFNCRIERKKTYVDHKMSHSTKTCIDIPIHLDHYRCNSHTYHMDYMLNSLEIDLHLQIIFEKFRKLTFTRHCDDSRQCKKDNRMNCLWHCVLFRFTWEFALIFYSCAFQIGCFRQKLIFAMEIYNRYFSFFLS